MKYKVKRLLALLLCGALLLGAAVPAFAEDEAPPPVLEQEDAEDLTFESWLEGIVEDIRSSWNTEEEKTTRERLRDMGRNFFLVVGSPILMPLFALMIMTMGPFGLPLLVIPLIMPFMSAFNLAKDFVALIKSIFN